MFGRKHTQPYTPQTTKKKMDKFAHFNAKIHIKR
jgi:hypothetical protein